MVRAGLVLISICLVACQNKGELESNSLQADSAVVDQTEKQLLGKNPFVISCEELDVLLKSNKDGYVLFDVRKQESYNEGHLMSAHQVWRNDFNEERNGVGSLIASQFKIESLLSAVGVNQEDTLILYDDRGGVNAARFWFVLSEYGWSQVKILNGGIVKWKEMNLPLIRESSLANHLAKFTFNPKPEFRSLNIKKEQVQESIGTIPLLDSRTIEEFKGDTIKKGALKGGRIASAQRFDYSELSKVASGEDHTFREPWVVLEKLHKLNISPSDSVIVYCHSGARSALLAFYFSKILDFDYVRNYDGSWIEWSRYDDLPFESIKDS